MSRPHKIIFQFGDGADHDASVSEASASVEFCFVHNWSMIPEVSGLDQNPTWTLEVSNDNVTWNPYDTLMQDAAIDQGFDDTHSNFLYYRINYNAQTNTTGTVKFIMVLK